MVLFGSAWLLGLTSFHLLLNPVSLGWGGESWHCVDQEALGLATCRNWLSPAGPWAWLRISWWKKRVRAVGKGSTSLAISGGLWLISLYWQRVSGLILEEEPWRLPVGAWGFQVWVAFLCWVERCKMPCHFPFMLFLQSWGRMPARLLTILCSPLLPTAPFPGFVVCLGGRSQEKRLCTILSRPAIYSCIKGFFYSDSLFIYKMTLSIQRPYGIFMPEEFQGLFSAHIQRQWLGWNAREPMEYCDWSTGSLPGVRRADTAARAFEKRKRCIVSWLARRQEAMLKSVSLSWGLGRFYRQKVTTRERGKCSKAWSDRVTQRGSAGSWAFKSTLQRNRAPLTS